MTLLDYLPPEAIALLPPWVRLWLGRCHPGRTVRVPKPCDYPDRRERNAEIRAKHRTNRAEGMLYWASVRLLARQYKLNRRTIVAIVLHHAN